MKQKGQVGNSNTDKKIRSSEVVGLPYGTKECNTLDSIIGKYINMANKECFGFQLNNIKEFQIAQYADKGFYDEHMDTRIDETASQRKLSVTVQLSYPDEYKGGDFEFTKGIPTPDSSTIRTRGTIIVFPSFLYHQITPVTDGTRHSLVGWYEGNKWR